ncbi:Aste57867_14773 [Aphanomyces stellatus]|uniref:Aste57867_14773 protein n=1 Tax=Aphanomyces stellatus TaxID=120398 RepID=A0A485L3A3_9STRA|nr:hypothetical protein As57867_014718 [Aphanomyces stellatus]VFT91591.1 Aste57867_14773 [Aphanomyces stellatus]
MEDGDKAVEQSPRGIYVRFEQKLGTGAYKTVYKAYDIDQGIDVAWNAIDIGALPHGEKARIIQEVELLKRLEHKNIINFYGSWFSKEKNQVVFITEIMTAGSLKSYIKRVHFIKWKIIKRWCLQILEGLHYLHSQKPPVIHRDLKCDNIFINGNTGDLRIGDLGLSTQMAVEKPRAQSVLGTPEFMAPELYDENYDEKVDIYAFGMCVLEMVTKEVPYSECANPAQIYKKVMAGIRPQGLARIKSQAAREFIELCLSRGNGQVDVTASYLMTHPFLQPSTDDDQMVECVDLHATPTPPLSPAHNSLKRFDMDESTSRPMDRNDKRRVSCPPLPLRDFSLQGPVAAPLAPLLPEDRDVVTGSSSQGNSLVFKNRPTTDAPLSAGVIAANDRAADAFLSTMKDTEMNLDGRKTVHDGRNTPLADDKKINLRDGKDGKPPPSSSSGEVPQRRGSVSDGAAVPAAPTSAPTPLSSQLPPIAPPLQKKASSGDAGIKSIVTATGIVGVSPTPIRKRGRRHEIKAMKDPSAPHSLLLSLRIILDGKTKEIKFPFNLFTDSAHDVACELAEDVHIAEPDVGDIADSISFLATEGKLANLPDVDVDVWEEAPEPHSFSSKPLPHVSKMNLVPHTNMSLELMDQPSSVYDDVASSNASFLSSSSTSSRDAYYLSSMDDHVGGGNGVSSSSSAPNSLSKRSSSIQDDGEWPTTNSSPTHSPLPSVGGDATMTHSAALRVEQAAHEKEIEKHEQEMALYRKKIEEIQIKKQIQLDKMQQLSAGTTTDRSIVLVVPTYVFVDGESSNVPAPAAAVDASSLTPPRPSDTDDDDGFRKPRPLFPSAPPVAVVKQ